MLCYDAVIIGFGKGGKTLAVDLANRGLRVAMVEKTAEMYGGTCINIACIPTKSLVHSAKLSEYKALKGFFEQSMIFSQAIAEKNNLTARLRAKNFDNLNNHANITVYTGTASFVSNYVINVKTNEGSIELQGEKIFINTGATPIIPVISGLRESARVLTSTTIMELTELPKHLAIIGGGYIGLEFASMFAGFGSQVTVFEAGTRLIPREDSDIAETVQTVLAQKGVQFKFGSAIQSVNDMSAGTLITYTQKDEVCQQQVDYVLIATGRKPNTADLNLSATDITLTERGAIAVDEYLRTSVPNIWAIGDVAGGLQFTYISLDDYRIVRDQLFGDKTRSTDNRRNIPYSVFIDPPLSRVGLSEQEAISQGYTITIAKLPAAGIPKAQVIKEPNGLLKTVIDAKTDKILGCVLFCAESHEMINLVKLAIDADLPYSFLKNQIFTHPTMSEALNDLFSTVK